MPVRLPSPQELAEDRILALDALYDVEGDDVALARERLRRLLNGGQIVCTPEDGVYLARAELLPLEAMLGHERETAAKGGDRCPRVVARGRFVVWSTRFQRTSRSSWWREPGMSSQGRWRSNSPGSTFMVVRSDGREPN